MFRVLFFSCLLIGLAACSDGRSSNRSKPSSLQQSSQPKSPVTAPTPTPPIVGDDFELRVADVSISKSAPSKSAVLPITLSSLSSHKAVSLQFDLVYALDSLELQDIAVGSSAQSSDKQVEWRLITPGHARVIIFGVNQNEIADGEIARLVFNVKSRIPSQPSVKPSSKSGSVVSLRKVEGAANSASQAKSLTGRSVSGTVSMS